MLQKIKRNLPKPIKHLLIALKARTINILALKIFTERMQKKNELLLAKVHGKEKIRVVFLVIHENTWKADEVFQRMMSDSFFEPIILVVPYITYNGSTNISLERTLEVQEKTTGYFSRKGYKVYTACDNTGSVINPIDALNPDLVYFSCPYPETFNEFYAEIFKEYLCFYIPYFYLIYSWGNDDKFYNTKFFNSMLKTYLPHKVAYDKALSTSYASSGQWFLSGYPSCESLYNGLSSKNAWHVSSENKIKLIWAPHHSIYEDVKPNLGSFLFVAEHLMQTAIKNKDTLHISFKPHPLLKAKLDDHPDWGLERTNAYYSFWDTSGFSQLDEGEYLDLFIGSDAMLHDSSSFLVEYLFVKKPVMYIDFKNNFLEQFNEFGIKAYNSCLIAKNTNDIEHFISSLLSNSSYIKEEHIQFLEKEINPFYKDKLPSERIIEDIKQSLGALSVH